MIEDTSSRPWATHEPPWAGALDKLAGRAKAAQQASPRRPAPSPHIRAEQLVEELENTAARLSPGAAFWYANDAAMNGGGTVYDAEHPHEPEPDEPELVPVEDTPNPLACQCGAAFRNDLGLICHRAVYTDPDHQNPTERMRRVLRTR